jgi:hypothetical protein
MLDIYATTASSDGRNFFANLGSTVLSFPEYKTYNGEASGSENGPFRESDNQHTNFEPNFPEYIDFDTTDGQWYLCGSHSQIFNQY